MSSNQQPLVAVDPVGDVPACSEASAEPVAIAIQNFSAKGSKQKVLKGLNAFVPGGKMCAVMGPSGSGKTSLIKTVCGVASNLTLSGEVVLCSGAAADNSTRANKTLPAKPVVSYVPQEDDLLPALTVAETLLFSAALQRVPKVASAVELLLADLGLQRCAQTRVRSAGRGGISGGERRRLSLAIRLLQKPALLCADEPTSGLDAKSAQTVVALLQQQTSHTCTVLCSIHQPRQEIFDNFGHLLLLTDGYLVYSGRPDCAVQYIEKCTSLTCPRSANPADFLIDVCALDRTCSERMQSSGARVKHLVNQQHEQDAKCAQFLERAIVGGASLLPGGPLYGRGGKRDETACRALSEIFILTRRAFVCARRDRLLFLAVVMQNMIFGFVFGYMNFQLSTATLPEIHSHLALVYITPGLSGFFVMSAALYLLCEQIAFFDNERLRDKLYTPVALVLSQFLAVLPINVVVPAPMFLLLYFLAGLRVDVVVAPCVFYAVLVLVRLHSTALAILFAVILPQRSYATSSVLANAFFLLCIFTGGFLTPIASLPRFVSWFRWIAYSYYSFRWNASAQFSDLTLDVGLPGKVILQQLGFHEHDFLVPPLSISGLTICWLILAVLALYVVKPRTAAASSFMPSDVAEEMEVSSFEGVDSNMEHRCVVNQATDTATAPQTSVGLSLQKVSLEVTASQRHRSNVEPKPSIKILEDVSVAFAPAQLSAIIGPSGAGKTSLLSVLAGRVGAGHGAGTCRMLKREGTYRLHGRVLLGNRPASQPELLQAVALVTQHDHHLPGLTVEEALHFASRLRLPHMTKETRQERVDSFTQALGLSGCLKNRIGTQARGGISGGERRRLSVAMACLGEPGALLLDEPTTGLDALAARQLVSLLNTLASERRQTMVCTIHQPRSDLIPNFHRILLLGPGGRVLLEGSSDDIRNSLNACKAPLPPTCNVLDFAMDLTADPCWIAKLHTYWIHSSGESNARPEESSTNTARGHDQATAASPVVFRSACPCHVALRVLLVRSLLNFTRQPAMIWARCAQVMLYAVVLVPIYAPLGNSQSSVTSRIGLLYQSLGILFAGTINNLAVFPLERDVFLREYLDGLYSTAPFFLAYSVVEFALESMTAVVAGVIIVQVSGLESYAQPQLVFIAVLIASLFNGESLGIIFNSVVMNAGFSVNMINGFCAILQIIAGFMANSLPPPLVALNRISSQMYACRALAVSQFPTDLEFKCDGPSPICIRNGADVLTMLGLQNAGSLRTNMIGLFLCCVTYRVMSFVVLQHRATQHSHG